MAVLQASHLKKYYGREESLVKALDDVSVSVEEGQFVAIIGTSGSGKSTLLNMLGGLDTPTSGGVQVEDCRLEDMKEEQLTVFRRRRIGFIFQNYNLIPYLTSYENIVLPVRLDGKTEDKKFLKEITEFLELDHKLANYPSHLSGGQQQRVAIARALISKPAIILADEPTGNLDSQTSDKVIDLLKMTSRKFHQTIVMITHNPEIAEKADRRIRIEDGKIHPAEEERAAQFRLQQLHLLADRRLGHVEFLGGPVDAALLDHGDKVVELFQIHGDLLYIFYITPILI